MKNFLYIFVFLSNTIFFNSIFAQEQEALSPKQMIWPFDGVMGRFDRQTIQRGYQVYKEVCAACHSLKRISYRNLKDIGFSEDEIKFIAAGYTVTDGPNDAGEMFTRAAVPTDYFVSPYPNQQAARVANNGAAPPDLSLMVKAREDGANHIYSILTGYQQPPEGFKMTNEDLHYNPYFTNRQIAMPEPLSDNIVTYADGTPSTKDQMAYDVVNFLQWAAEPEMEKRKLIGVKTILFLLFFTIISYIAKGRIWARLDNEGEK
ncbi:MAG: cytochrome c1 [Rickettsiaceae bacterium]|nr:cytochrome c1 [Rickettsiaceae bacterium]